MTKQNEITVTNENGIKVINASKEYDNEVIQIGTFEVSTTVENLNMVASALEKFGSFIAQVERGDISEGCLKTTLSLMQFSICNLQGTLSHEAHQLNNMLEHSKHGRMS